MFFRRLSKVILFFACLSFVITKTTSADFVDRKLLPQNGFVAATLDFESLSTANNNIQSELFNVPDLVPGGMTAATLRIKNSTPNSFKYHLGYQGDTEGGLCPALNLNVIKNSQSVFSGPLSHFSLDNFDMTPNGQDDWVLLLSLDSGSSQKQLSQNCIFQILIRASSSLGNESSGFKENWTLSNQVTSHP